MLAQNFKTPTELKISDVEFDALFKVLGMLERGEIEPHKFDMATWDSDCGTIHCVGGWARTLAGRRAFPIGGRPRELENMFYPGAQRLASERVVSGYGATIPQAAIALRNYLTHGEPRWDEALQS